MSSDAAGIAATDDFKRWCALLVLSFGGLLTAVDLTIVSVALASIRIDLSFTEAAAIWVVNGYMITYAALLLLSGRLADRFGHRGLLLIGIAIFTLASLGCGLAPSRELLIVARAAQGVGGAIITVLTLALAANLFADSNKRVKGLSIFAFACTCGGSLGVLLGGVLTSTWGWRSIFLINIPAGVLLFALCLAVVPASIVRHGAPASFRGAISQLLRVQSFATANVVGVLFSVTVQAWIFISALFLQLVLGFSAIEASLAILPASVLRAVTSLSVAPWLIKRFGVKPPLVAGMLAAAVGLAILGRAPVNADPSFEVIPWLLLIGLGIGLAYNAVVVSALLEVPPGGSGTASGIVHTSFTLGGALGLALLAGIAAARTRELFAADAGQLVALMGGYHAAFWLGAAVAVCGALIGGIFLRTRTRAYVMG